MFYKKTQSIPQQRGKIMSANIKYTKYSVNGKEFDFSITQNTLYNYVFGMLSKCSRKSRKPIHVTRTTFTQNCQNGKMVLQKDVRKRHFYLDHYTACNFMAWLSDYPKYR